MSALIWLVIAVIAAGSPLARADVAQRRDRNDTPGPLDVKMVHHAHEGTSTRHAVITHDAWRSRTLRHRTDWIALEFSTDRQDGWERLLWIRYSAERGIYGKLYRLGDQATPVFLHRVTVRRTNRTGVTVLLSPEDLGIGRGATYNWLASSSYEARRGPCRSNGTTTSDAFPPLGVCTDITRTLTHQT